MYTITELLNMKEQAIYTREECIKKKEELIKALDEYAQEEHNAGSNGDFSAVAEAVKKQEEARNTIRALESTIKNVRGYSNNDVIVSWNARQPGHEQAIISALNSFKSAMLEALERYSECVDALRAGTEEAGNYSSFIPPEETDCGYPAEFLRLPRIPEFKHRDLKNFLAGTITEQEMLDIEKKAARASYSNFLKELGISAVTSSKAEESADTEAQPRRARTASKNKE